MSHLYVLSSKALSGRYKIGKHTGDLDRLKSRYITSIPDVVIHVFIECNADTLEKQVHSRLSKHRIDNCNGNLSEWFKCSLPTIKKAISLEQKDKPVIKEVEHICQAVTLKGTRCTNRAKVKQGGKYLCGVHNKDDTLTSMMKKLSIK